MRGWDRANKMIAHLALREKPADRDAWPRRPMAVPSGGIEGLSYWW